MGQKIGYARVSTPEQDASLQLKGLNLDRRFVETASGKTAERPQLAELLNYVREGDCVYVQSIDRMARNLIDLRNIIDRLTKKKVRIEFLREMLVFTGEDSPTSLLFLNLLGTLAEFERNLMLERQRDGIAQAKARGAYRGGKKKLTEEQIYRLKERVEKGVPKARVAREFGITRETLYQYLKTVPTLSCVNTSAET